MPLTVTTPFVDKWGNSHPFAWAYIDFVALRQGQKLAGMEVWLYPSKAAADDGKPPIAEYRIDIVEGGIPAVLGEPDGDGDPTVLRPAVPSFATLIMRIWDEYSALEAKLAEVVCEVLPEFAGATHEPPSIS